MYDVALLVHGRDVPASDGAVYERRNPVTGEIATRAAAATLEDARAAAASSAAAFDGWSSLGPAERRKRLSAAAAELERRADDFCEAMAQEIGATESWGRYNVAFAAAVLREAAAMTTSITGEIIPSDRPGLTAMALREPVGVVLGLAPWNAPVILGVRAIAMPLACGNTVVLKASEICPRTHRLIGDAFLAAGCGEGAVNIVNNAPDDASRIVEALIAHPTIRRVNFTGSTRVGRHIAELAARYLKPALLELGGKAPLLVLDDADLDEAVAAAAYGAFMNQGQICMSTERVIVDESLADAFARLLTAKAATLVAGDNRKAKTPLGSVVNLEAIKRVLGLVHDAVAKGARLLTGGHANGVLMDATVLDHVTPAMRIYNEETLRPRRLDHPRQRGRRGRAGRQRYRVRPQRRRVRARSHARARRRAPHRIRHLPHQWADRERRAANALRRRQSVGLRPVRRRRRHSGVYRIALDNVFHWQGTISNLSAIACTHSVESNDDAQREEAMSDTFNPAIFANGSPTISRRGLILSAGAAGLALAGGARGAYAAGADNVLRVGFISPRTGPLGGFGQTDGYVLDVARAALKKGLKIGDKTYEVKILDSDTQSDPSRAGQLAKSLINGEGVDLMLAVSTPETINPVADACEAAGVPCLSTVMPWEAWYFGRGAKPGAPSPFKWTYHFGFGGGEFFKTYVSQWSLIPTNKKVGVLYPNDADGNAIRANLAPALAKAGFTIVDPGPTRTEPPIIPRRSRCSRKKGARFSTPSRSRPISPPSGVRRRSRATRRSSRSARPRRPAFSPATSPRSARLA